MTTRAHGRPRVTSHAAIELAAFELFERRGFEATTLDDIAAAVGIGRRTLFRYYPSKNDILWGQFDDSLRAFEAVLAASPDDVPLGVAIRDAVVAFNHYPEEALPQHRRRMRLLLQTPALQGHSELRYAAWREVVAEFVATRVGQAATDLVAVTAGRVALALSLTAYQVWLDEPNGRIEDLLEHAFASLVELYAVPVSTRVRPESAPAGALPEAR